MQYNNPSLSYYIKFYQVLDDLLEEQLITSKEKSKLKVSLALSDPDLLNLLRELDEPSFKQDLICFVQSKPTVSKSPLSRRRSLLQDSPIKIRKSQFNNESYSEEEILQSIDNCYDILYSVVKQREYMPKTVNDKLKQLAELISKVPSPQQSIIFINDLHLTEEVKSSYLSLKNQYSQYMKSHLILLDEKQNVYNALKIMIQQLVNYDEFTIVSFQGNFDSQSNLYQGYQEIPELQGNHLKQIKLDGFATSFIINVEQDYLVLHQSEQRQSLLELAIEYQFEDEVEQLARFIIKTVREARIQTFSAFQVQHMIQDIGINFVRCSKYQFITQILDILKQRYVVDKQIVGSINSLSTSPTLKNITKQVNIEFKDIKPIQMNIAGFDLGRKDELALYKLIQSLYNKYTKFIEQCYDRNTLYKFYMKSRDSIIFEFDKKGCLYFLSRPIPQHLKDEFQINFIVNGHFKNIFKHQGLLQSLDEHMSNRWMLSEHNQIYEIFMKTEEKKFKGFAIIFQEGLIKDKHLDGEVKQIKLQQETLEYIAKLEQNNPEIKDTIFSMFIPSQHYQSYNVNLHVEKRRKCIFNEIINIPIPVAMQNIEPEEIETAPEAEQILDDFSFNVLQYSSNSVEKQRIVFNTLLRNGFIDKFQIEIEPLCEFLSELEYKYNKRSNPFHNYDHGINVMHSCHVICLKMNNTQYKGILNDITKFALIVGGLCHDVGHTGRTNIFEMNSLSQLAVRYHDKSVLEQYHAATALKILLKDDKNFLANMDFRTFRKLFIQNILYTDIAEHFNLLKNFEAITTINENEIKLLTGMIIHTSDFAGGASQFQISQQWSFKVNKEFEAQYNEEGRNGYPQQPFMKDLHKLSVISKAEMGFFKFLVRPLFVSLSKFLDNIIQDRVDNLDNTIIEWDKVHQQALIDEQNQNIQ